MRVKICGITSVEDALLAESVGADAIGLIFAETSKRYVNFDTAESISSALGVFVARVGVFVNAPIEQVVAYSRKLGLNAVQLHGDEDEVYARALRRRMRVIRALSFDKTLDLAYLKTLEADAILLDNAQGGSGQTFDWNEAKALKDFPQLIVAGGLGPDNVAQAIETLSPYAVDVASGVESKAGIKDPKKLQDFVSIAKRAQLSKVIHKE